MARVRSGSKKKAKRPAAKKPVGKKTVKSAAKKRAAKKPAAKKPAARKASKKPAARKRTSTSTSTSTSTTRTGARTSRGTTSRAGGGPAIAAPRFHVPAGPARQRLRDALAWVEDFVAECVRLATEEGPMPWEHADTLELVGLERWGIELARTDRETGVCALVLAAQHGLPRVLAVGGAELDSMGFVGDEMLDGASVESQLDRCARWVDDPSATNRDRVQDGFDPTRQLHTWDPDLKPHDTKAYFWYAEIGQLASAAVVKGDGDAASTSYYYWPFQVCVGRGLVVAVRGLRQEGGDVHQILRDLYAALTA